VIYAAKSTEDRRGSIPEQLRECREAIEGDPRRELVAEYEDEAFSAYRRDRGPGLRDATQHAEDLAVQRGIAELWAQHSDRIARGDGRAARHTVEVALWALKSDVRVQTLQDPDTFRDLLYAVVTGQRNNEDSKRKALATQAGRRRAAQRGEFIGHLPDGYHVIRWLDEHEQLRRRVEFDPERQPLYELIFRLALRGRSPGQIATTVNRAGWLTKPVKRADAARPFDVRKVYDVLRNVRYAGLSVFRGEVMARGAWPSYITERQHERILRQVQSRRLGICEQMRSRETYLLARLGRCGHCGAALRAHTGRYRADGSPTRSYHCSSHATQRGSHRCGAPPIEAHMAEAMVAASVGALLLGDAPESPGSAPPTTRTNPPHDQLRAAVLADDERGLEQAIEYEFSRLQPHAALIRQTAISQRQARELADAERLRTWIAQERAGRTDESREQCAELNALLRSWFSQISIKVSATSVELSASRRPGAQAPRAPARLSIDRRSWARSAGRQGGQLRRYVTWERSELLGALQGWADVHGRSPKATEWRQGDANRPGDITVRHTLGTWSEALRKAGLPPAPGTKQHEPWPRARVIASLQAWARRHRRSPASTEWIRTGPGRPCTDTVRREFGSWADALHAAGLEVPVREPQLGTRWASEQILEALLAWTASHGRVPVGPDWLRSAHGHPCTATVYTRFGSWGTALAAAGLTGQDRFAR
jgi:Resolvase, N terminal domain/Homing endonuclease associated repeat/Recombinase zinc beta ribbon domain/Recombinase